MEGSRHSSNVHQHTDLLSASLGTHPPTAAQCDQIAEELQYNTLLACSNGAYCPDSRSSSHGWILASEIQQEISTGAGPDNAIPELRSSYCSELGGILAILYIIHRICQHY
jgi:hypothetical protein